MSTAGGLTQAQLEELRDELQSERTRLERSIKAQSVANDESAHVDESPYDVANGGGGLGTELETSTIARLEAIVAALARFDDGTYGICTGCQTAIPYGRLIVMPESMFCVACGPRP